MVGRESPRRLVLRYLAVGICPDLDRAQLQLWIAQRYQKDASFCADPCARALHRRIEGPRPMKALFADLRATPAGLALFVGLLLAMWVLG